MIINVITLLIIGASILLMVSLIPFSIWMMTMAGRRQALLKREGVTTDAEVINWEWQKPLVHFVRSPSSSPLAGIITYRYYVDMPSQARQLFTNKENVWVAVHLKYPIGLIHSRPVPARRPEHLPDC